jgi:hypothetical protein
MAELEQKAAAVASAAAAAGSGSEEAAEVVTFFRIFRVHGPQYAFVLTRTSLPPSLYSSSSSTTTITT